MRVFASWRSPVLFPALVFVTLVLFAVPEVQVHSLRAWALLKLEPVLKLAAGSHAEQTLQPALISVKLPQTPAAGPAENHAEEIDCLKSEVVRLCNEVSHLRTALPGQGQALNEPAAVGADVIARKVLWQEPILGLNRGEAEGVRLHAGVLHRGAVVGRIEAVSAHAASMALLTHRGMSIGARLVDCRAEGILQGTKTDDGGERLCRMTVVGRELKAKTGEQVVTSGCDGSFPPGLWLGVVTAIKKTSDVQWELSIRPASNENAIECVRVLTGAQPEVPWPAGPVNKKEKKL